MPVNRKRNLHLQIDFVNHNNRDDNNYDVSHIFNNRMTTSLIRSIDSSKFDLFFLDQVCQLFYEGAISKGKKDTLYCFPLFFYFFRNILMPQKIRKS